METSQTQNSDGKTLNKIVQNILIFLSPKMFWSVYGYWFANICYVFSRYIFWEHTYMEFPAWLKPVLPAYYGDETSIFFFAVPLFFFITVFLLSKNIYKRDYKIGRYFVFHILLMIFLSEKLYDLVNGVIWVFGR